MIAPRRYLPSVSALLALEAVARLGSATEAARELDLTQSAVSRQLKTLEAQLGVTLILRQGRGLILSAEGRSYVDEIRLILHRLAQASVTVRDQCGRRHAQSCDPAGLRDALAGAAAAGFRAPAPGGDGEPVHPPRALRFPRQHL